MFHMEGGGVFAHAFKEKKKKTQTQPPPQNPTRNISENTQPV